MLVVAIRINKERRRLLAERPWGGEHYALDIILIRFFAIAQSLLGVRATDLARPPDAAADSRARSRGARCASLLGPEPLQQGAAYYTKLCYKVILHYTVRLVWIRTSFNKALHISVSRKYFLLQQGAGKYEHENDYNSIPQYYASLQ